jgi:glycosyltransferase involved in cell wall biosynthesis
LPERGRFSFIQIPSGTLNMVYLSFSFPHHGEYSSYHRITKYLREEDKLVDSSLPKVFYRKLLNPRNLTVKLWREIGERVAWARVDKGSGDWIHYLYPEHSCRNIDVLRKQGVNVAMSCHLPEQAIQRGKYCEALKRGLSSADALIVMSPDYVDCYQSIAPQAKVCFIPHGIDIHYFRPPVDPESFLNRESSTLRFLTVGNMMRDFETLASVINLAAERKLDVVFRVVANPNSIAQLQSLLTEKGRSFLEAYCGISNDELKQLYFSSHLLFLPLLDATANNAILEALACGLPICVSDLPATRAYGGEAACYYSGKDPDEIVNRLIQLGEDREKCRELAALGRSHAVNELSWESIVARHQKFIEET